MDIFKVITGPNFNELAWILMILMNQTGFNAESESKVSDVRRG